MAMRLQKVIIMLYENLHMKCIELHMDRDKKRGGEVKSHNTEFCNTGDKTFSYSESDNGETILIGLYIPMAERTENAKTLP